MAALTALGLLLAGCCSLPSDQDPAPVRNALQKLTLLQLHMELDGIADLFLPDGEMITDDDAPLVGPDAIRAHLAQFREFKVNENRMIASETLRQGHVASQKGRFEQRIRLPDQTIAEAAGEFEALWVRGSDGQWKLRRLTTRSEPT
jgi:uncharacterized protein (TIGR02246 family)